MEVLRMSTNNNDQYDLFSYFGGSESFATPSETKTELPKAPILASDATLKGGSDIANAETAPETLSNDKVDEDKSDNKVVHIASKRIREKRLKETQIDACVDEDEDDDKSGNIGDELDEDEQEALEEDGEVDEDAAEKAELGGKTANSVVKADDKSTVAADGKKEEKKPEFNHATFVAYAGHTLSITKFFTEESLATLDLEAVRKRLEKDFPELSKQRTKMEWDEKKNLICPMVTGGKKGAFFSLGLRGFFFRSKDLFENKEPINILAARDGYYEVRENPIGVFIAKVDIVEDLEPCRPAFKLTLPKIPQYLFAQLISFFADYAMHEVEVMGVFYWDMETKQYLLDVPFQNVSKVKVDACYSSLPSSYIKVAEIHSHNTMRAYFSDVDNEDETGTMLYGVVGRLQSGLKQITYDLKTRAGVAGRFIPLEPIVMIEGDSVEMGVRALDPMIYPSEWDKRVQIIVKSQSREVINND
jgi:hypothetical protein